MEIQGLCDICGKTGVLYTCMLCGRRACVKCFQPREGVCRNCAGGRAGEHPAVK